MTGERERVAAWMIALSLPTGHGDTTEDLLKEAAGSIKRLRERIARLEDAMRNIQARAAAGNRTFDEASRDLYWCHCEANRALSAPGADHEQ